MSELLLRQFDLSPGHPWGNEALRLILCDVFGWPDRRISEKTWMDPQAHYYLGLGGGRPYHYWGLADSADRLLAVAALDPNLLDKQKIMIIDSLVVSREERSCGYGTEMLYQLDDVALEAGATALQLNCLPPLRQYYENRDFVCIDSFNGIMMKQL